MAWMTRVQTDTSRVSLLTADHENLRLVWVRDQSLTDPALSVPGRRDLTRVSVCVRRRVAHAVSNQRLLALDDVSLNPSVVVPPLPEREADKTLLNTDDCDAELHLHRMDL